MLWVEGGVLGPARPSPMCTKRINGTVSRWGYTGPAPAAFSSAFFCFLGAFGLAVEDSSLLFLLDFPVLDSAGKGKETVGKIPHTPCTEVPNRTRVQDPGMPEEPSSKMNLTGAYPRCFGGYKP